MQELKESVTNLNEAQIEEFRNEEKRRRELEFKTLNHMPESQKLSKGEKKRAKRARRSEYGNPCTLR